MAEPAPPWNPGETRFLAYWRRFLHRVALGMNFMSNARETSPGQDRVEHLLAMAIESFTAANRDWQVVWLIANPNAMEPDYEGMVHGYRFGPW